MSIPCPTKCPTKYYFFKKGVFFQILLHSSFNSSQKDKLISLFHEKNKKLIKALEKYESDLDKNTIYVTFNDLISMN